MNAVIVRVSSKAEIKARFAAAVRGAQAGQAAPSIEFATYDDMHKVLSPARIAIVKALAGRNFRSVRLLAGLGAACKLCMAM